MRSKDKLQRYIKHRSKSELMNESDFIKILPSQHDFGGAFTGDRADTEDLIVQGESKLEREALSLLASINDEMEVNVVCQGAVEGTAKATEEVILQHGYRIEANL